MRTGQLPRGTLSPAIGAAVSIRRPAVAPAAVRARRQAAAAPAVPGSWRRMVPLQPARLLAHRLRFKSFPVDAAEATVPVADGVPGACESSAAAATDYTGAPIGKPLAASWAPDGGCGQAGWAAPDKQHALSGSSSGRGGLVASSSNGSSSSLLSLGAASDADSAASCGTAAAAAAGWGDSSDEEGSSSLTQQQGQQQQQQLVHDETAAEAAEEEEDGHWWSAEGEEEEEGEEDGAWVTVGTAGDAIGDAGATVQSSVAAASAAAAAQAQGLSIDGATVLDIATDSGLALRLVDVFTDEENGSSGSNGGSTSGRGNGEELVAEVMVGEGRGRMRARPPSFCTNCCAPRERLPSGADAACGVCGHDAAEDAQLLPPRPPGGWGSAAAAQAGDPARAEAAAALWAAAAAARAAGLPCLPPARVLLAWHEDCLLHRGMLPPWPERPERLHAVLARLQGAGLLDVCDRMPVDPASDEALLAVHTAELVSAIDALSPETAFAEQLDAAGISGCLGPDSLGNRHTARAARLAAGAAAGMAERLVRGEADAGFALVRPAGHLTSEGRAEGGNLYNNVAIAARAAQRAGAARVMIVDWDAHAAKGTASIFEDDPTVMVVSMHKSGSWFYPGGCPLTQVGRGAAAGTTVNIAWSAPPRSGSPRRADSVALEDVQPSGPDYLAALGAVVVPLAREWGPDLVLVSAGFDSADGDPVGLGSVPPPAFAHMTAMLRAIGPPVGLVLEGGYVLRTTARCVELCVRALLGERPPPLAGFDTCAPSAVGWNTIVRTLAVHQHFWSSLGTVTLANAVAAAGGGAPAGGAPAAATAAAAGGAAAGAAALDALIAAAAAEGGEEDEEGEFGEEDEEEWGLDGDWQEDEDEDEEGAAGEIPLAEVEAVGPGEWAGESA